MRLSPFVLVLFGFIGCADGHRAAEVQPPPRVAETPTAVAPRVVPVASAGEYRKLAVGARGACAIDNDARVSCWGNHAAAFVRYVGPTRSSAPLFVPGLPAALEIAVGDEHACALTQRSGVYCWGSNVSLSRDDDAILAPTRVTAFDGAVRIFAGGRTTCAATPAETRCVGGLAGESFQPAILSSSPPRAMAFGQSRGCFLLGAGDVRCWDTYATTDNTPQKAKPSSALAGATSLSAGGDWFVGTSAGGRLLESRAGRGNPVRVGEEITLATVASPGNLLSGGADRVCALSRYGLVCHNGTQPPIAVQLDSTDVVEIGVGATFACARHRSSVVECWGGAADVMARSVAANETTYEQAGSVVKQRAAPVSKAEDPPSMLRVSTKPRSFYSCPMNVIAPVAQRSARCGNGRRDSIASVADEQRGMCGPPGHRGTPVKCAIETCDGADLGPATCASAGFGGGGVLRCNATCGLDTSACRPCPPGTACQSTLTTGTAVSVASGESLTLAAVTRGSGCFDLFALAPKAAPRRLSFDGRGGNNVLITRTAHGFLAASSVQYDQSLVYAFDQTGNPSDQVGSIEGGTPLAVAAGNGTALLALSIASGQSASGLAVVLLDDSTASRGPPLTLVAPGGGYNQGYPSTSVSFDGHVYLVAHASAAGVRVWEISPTAELSVRASTRDGVPGALALRNAALSSDGSHVFYDSDAGLKVLGLARGAPAASAVASERLEPIAATGSASDARVIARRRTSQYGSFNSGELMLLKIHDGQIVGSPSSLTHAVVGAAAAAFGSSQSVLVWLTGEVGKSHLAALFL